MEEVNTVTNGSKRRNSLPSAVVIPPLFLNGKHHVNNHNHKLNGSSSPSPSASYTSLKDFLPNSPSSVLSPSPVDGASAGVSSASSGSSYEISIRNRLVKQAAWAYLQPAVSSSPSSSTRRLIFSGEVFKTMVESCRRAVSETVTRVYDWVVDVLWLILCR